MAKYLAIVLTVVSFSASAQIYGNRIGNMQYENGNIGGQTYNSTTQRIGNMEYQNGSIGGKTFNCTTQYIGNQVYKNCN